MFFHLRPLLLSFVILLGYELAVYRYDLSTWILVLMSLAIIWGCYKIIGHWTSTLLPILFYVGSSGLLFFVSGGLFLQVYILLNFLAFYLILLSLFRLEAYQKDETARRIHFIMSLATIFNWCAFLFAFYLNRNVPSWAISIIIFGITLVVTYQLLQVAVLEKFINYRLHAFAIAYCIMVISWGMFFLPFGYLTLASLVLACFFAMTNYIIQTCRGEFNRMSFVFDMFIFLFSVSFVLASARWHLVDN